MLIRVSGMPASDGTFIEEAVPIYTSIGRDDIFTDIRDLPEFLCDKDTKGCGVGSSGAADSIGTTAFAGAEDSLLGILLGPEEPAVVGWARTASVRLHLGARAVLTFFLFTTR